MEQYRTDLKQLALAPIKRITDNSGFCPKCVSTDSRIGIQESKVVCTDSRMCVVIRVHVQHQLQELENRRKEQKMNE